jgi:CDP-diacylglycerol--glycerol-3-phosphate 3-phosphatidyltransferase
VDSENSTDPKPAVPSRRSEKLPVFPLALTLLRLGLTPVFLVVFHVAGPWLSLLTALIIELSDLVDGAVARRWNQVTDLGKLLDPLADSVSRLTIYACFASEELIPVWAFLVLMYRDAAVAMTRTLCAYRREVLSARISGKIKAWFQGTGEITILGGCALAGGWHPHGIYLVVGIVVAGVTTWSGIDYLWSHRGAYRTSPLDG